MTRCAPPIDNFENDFHEVWWNSLDFLAPKGRPQRRLHEVWQWMGDGDKMWRRPGESEPLTAEDAFREGWRYVRPIKLLDEYLRMDGEPPTLPAAGQAVTEP